MNLYDHYDAKSLFALKTIIDEKSRVKAARILGIKESSLHYRLEKLRKLTNDALIKTENGIVTPTKRGRLLYETACKIHGLLEAELTYDKDYNYTRDKKSYTIFCNDLFGSLIAPFLLDKAESLGTISLSIFIVPDADDSLVGKYLADTYYSMLKNEVVDLLILSDSPCLDFTGLKRSLLDKVRVTMSSSAINASTLEEQAGPKKDNPTLSYLTPINNEHSVSSFRLMEQIVGDTLFEAPLPKRYCVDNSSLIQSSSKEFCISVFQYWYGEIVDDKSHAFLRRLIRTICSELQITD